MISVLGVTLVLLAHFVESRDASMTNYIVGGVYTKIKSYPHSVFLFMTCGKNPASWYCGGSIMNQNLVLTAAHCLSECRTNYKIDVFAGHADWHKSEIVRDGKRFVLHGHYDKVSVRNDIAIVFLRKKLPLGKLVQRITICKRYPTFHRLFVAGWGVINDKTDETSSKLKAVKQQVIPYKMCSDQDKSPGALCAENALKENRPSSGDSGSALITDNYEQVGLVSYRRNSDPNKVIYTNVTYYIKWIYDASKVIFCKGKKR